MTFALTNTYDGNGIAEDFEDIIWDISPEETPFMQVCKRLKAGQTYHQWQTDSLAAATTNAQIEGLDSTFATLSPTTTVGNYCQISSKTVKISGTYDVVRKYGRKSETAYQLMKAGKELKRDMEYALVRNQVSSAGGMATARATGGIEAWIATTGASPAGNGVKATGCTAATNGGFQSGVTAAVTDGTAVTFIEANLQTALGLAWTDGGDSSLILMSSVNKARFSAFSGIATKYNEVKGSTQGVIIGAADIYVSDFGNHTVKMDRFMRDQAVLCIDPGYVGVATLRPMEKQELARIGDSTNYLLLTEYCLVVQNPSAHAKVTTVGA